MLLVSDPVRARIRHSETGVEHEVLIGELVMDEPADEGLTTGWYWRTDAAEGTEDKMDAWRTAVQSEHGPHRNAEGAVAAVAYWSWPRAAMAQRLNEAAELVRKGDIAPTPDDVSEWLTAAKTIDDASRQASGSGPHDPDSRRTAEINEARRPVDGTVTPSDET